MTVRRAVGIIVLVVAGAVAAALLGSPIPSLVAIAVGFLVWNRAGSRPRGNHRYEPVHRTAAAGTGGNTGPVPSPGPVRPETRRGFAKRHGWRFNAVFAEFSRGLRRESFEFVIRSNSTNVARGHWRGHPAAVWDVDWKHASGIGFMRRRATIVAVHVGAWLPPLKVVPEDHVSWRFRSGPRKQALDDIQFLDQEFNQTFVVRGDYALATTLLNTGLTRWLTAYAPDVAWYTDSTWILTLASHRSGSAHCEYLLDVLAAVADAVPSWARDRYRETAPAR